MYGFFISCNVIYIFFPTETEDVKAEDNSNIHIRLHVDTLAKCVFFL